MSRSAAAQLDPRSLALHELKEDGAVGDDPVAALEAAGHGVIGGVPITESHLPANEGPVRKRHIDKRQVLVIKKDRRDRHQKTRANPARLDRDVDVHLLLEKPTWIGRDDAGDHGASVRGDTRRHIIDGAVKWTGAV